MTGRVSVPGLVMQMNTASARFTVVRSLGAPGIGEKPTKRWPTLSKRQIAVSALPGLMAAATVAIGVPLGQVAATLLHAAKSWTCSVLVEVVVLPLTVTVVEAEPDNPVEVVTVSVTVKVPGLVKVCVVVWPAPVLPSPKLHWYCTVTPSGTPLALPLNVTGWPVVPVYGPPGFTWSWPCVTPPIWAVVVAEPTTAVPVVAVTVTV